MAMTATTAATITTMSIVTIQFRLGDELRGIVVLVQHGPII
jgi:hypothetical protein